VLLATSGREKLLTESQGFPVNLLQRASRKRHLLYLLFLFSTARARATAHFLLTSLDSSSQHLSRYTGDLSLLM